MANKRPLFQGDSEIGKKIYPGASDPGGLGGRTLPRIRDLYSKKISKNFSYSLGPPLDRNRSVAPAYNQDSI